MSDLFGSKPQHIHPIDPSEPVGARATSHANDSERLRHATTRRSAPMNMIQMHGGSARGERLGGVFDSETLVAAMERHWVIHSDRSPGPFVSPLFWGSENGSKQPETDGTRWNTITWKWSS